MKKGEKRIMASFKNLTFLKVLAVIAWADGEITESEKNILKGFYRKFGLEKSHLDELKPYLNAPLPKKEQDKLFKQLVAELDSKKERQQILEDLESMSQADQKVSSEESELLEQFSRILEKSNPTRRSFGKIKNFFHSKLFAPAHERNPELNRYFKGKVMKQIEMKRDAGKRKFDLEDDEVYFICLFGTLLASVAHVDDHFHEEEKKALKKILKERFKFTPRELELIFEVIEDQARRGFDFHEVVTEFNRLYSYKDRLQTVDCFFVMAAADGEISHDESEEIRRITKAMHISHQVFKEGKKKIRKVMEG